MDSEGLTGVSGQDNRLASDFQEEQQQQLEDQLHLLNGKDKQELSSNSAPRGAITTEKSEVVANSPLHGHSPFSYGSSDALCSSTPPAPDDPQLDQNTLHELLHLMEPKVTARRFLAEEITQDEGLAVAARREMERLQSPQTMLQSQQGVGLEFLRQQAAVEAINADAAEESKVNREVAELVVQRLEDGKRGLAPLLRLLHGLLAAELAYASAMQVISRQALCKAGSRPQSTGGGLSRAGSRGGHQGDLSPAPSINPSLNFSSNSSALSTTLPLSSSEDPLQSLVLSLAQLPDTISQSHQHLHGSLSSLTADLQKLYDQFCDACTKASPEAYAAHVQVLSGRQALTEACAVHGEVCRSFDVVQSIRMIGHTHKGPDNDPWASEGRLARAHKELQASQTEERAILRRSFHLCRELEGRRMELTKQAVAVTAGSYRAALLPVQHDLMMLMESAQEVDTSLRLEKLAKAANNASELAEQFSKQQAHSMEVVCQELFCSPEIVRQGEMQYIDAPFSRWTRGHFVLTRAGFLHWFKSVDQMEPLGHLALSKCQFEDGTAYCFHVQLKTTGWLVTTRGHRYSFQAPSVEDCCEWAVAIKEAIAVASGKALQYEEMSVRGQGGDNGQGVEY